MIESRRDQQLRLADGRCLGYAEFGAAAGRPVLFMHGFPGSRLEAQLGDAAARRQGVRLLAVDRPGYGLSDPLPGRTLRDWPADVAQLATALKLPRFALLGVSGGGPFALACAALLGERCTALTLVCPLGPVDEPGSHPFQSLPMRILLRLGRRLPGSARWQGGRLQWLLSRRPEWILEVLSRTAAPVDRQILSCGEIREVMAASSQAAFAQGGLGPAADMAIYGSPWNLDLTTLHGPVRLWQGGADRATPPAMAAALVAQLPNCRLELLPDEGHFSLPIRQMDAILAELAAD